MIVYEVELEIERAIAAAFRAWLPGHVREILDLPGFLDAALYEIEGEPAPAPLGLRVQYRVQDRAALERYFAHDAARLRADAVARFGSAFRARRRVLQPLPAA